MRFTWLAGTLLLWWMASSLHAEEERVFTDTAGRTVKATVVRVDDAHVRLRIRTKEYTWPLEKLTAEDRAYLREWKTASEASRKQRLSKLVGSFPAQALTHRAYPRATDYLGGELFESYLARTVPEYREDSLQALAYAIEEQTAALFVPPNYEETAAFGVYVEVTSGPRGQLPRPADAAVFAQHKLIYVCPHGAGNTAALSYRMGLALDALASVKAAYHIDSQRCFIGGVSGGGVAATMICYLRPAHFRGAINIARGALLESYTIQESVRFFGGKRAYEKGQTYPPFLPHIANRHTAISLRYKDKRWAFISGEKDFNYEFSQASGAQWIERGYRARYFHVPGMGHSDPPAETLDAVLTWMSLAAPAPGS